MEVDSHCVVQMVNSQTECINEYTPICSIRDLIKRNWVITINHVYCEANFAVDFLAKYVLELLLELHLFSIPPLEVVNFIANDFYGIAYSRYVLR